MTRARGRGGSQCHTNGEQHPLRLILKAVRLLAHAGGGRWPAQHADHAPHTLFVADLDALVGALVGQIAERGLDPMSRETYSNGVRKITYRDPDGNEIGFGGAAHDPA